MGGANIFVTTAVVHVEFVALNNGAGGVYDSWFPIIFVMHLGIENGCWGAIQNLGRVIFVEDHGANSIPYTVLVWVVLTPTLVKHQPTKLGLEWWSASALHPLVPHALTRGLRVRTTSM